jgi:hypothetical protein
MLDLTPLNQDSPHLVWNSEEEESFYIYIYIYIYREREREREREGRQHWAKQQGVSVAVFIWNAEACLQRVREELKCGIWWAFLRRVWRLMRSICHVCVWVHDRRKVGRGRKDDKGKKKKERKGRGVRNKGKLLPLNLNLNHTCVKKISLLSILNPFLF